MSSTFKDIGISTDGAVGRSKAGAAAPGDYVRVRH